MFWFGLVLGGDFVCLFDWFGLFVWSVGWFLIEHRIQSCIDPVESPEAVLE